MAKPTRLSSSQRRALALLSRARVVDGFYLAGGSGLALLLGHRRSLDLELFSDAPNVDLNRVLRLLRRAVPDLRVIARTDAMLKLEAAGASVDLVSYPYPPLARPEESSEGVRVAGLMDLAVMKLAVVAQRGLRRDYWDFYEILRSGVTIESVARAFLKRFGKTEADLYHVARALTFFEDTDRDLHFPRGLTRAKWGRIKAFLSAEAPKIVRTNLAEASGAKQRRRRKARSPSSRSR